MKKALLLLTMLGCSMSWVPTYATTITIDLGPTGRVTGEKTVNFSGLNDLNFSGQTLSLDLVFSGNGFVRLFKSTSPTFLLLPMLDVFGAGTINDPTGSGYLFNKAGHPISSVTSFGGSVTTDPGGEAFRLALGGFFPLLAGGTFPPDIYGAHLDITLPNASAFNVTGGELGLFPNASQRWHNQFQIGDVPESGCTLFLALIAVVSLVGLDAAMRQCRSM
ncbi:MAG: hypothetical protein DME45_04300 [Verrucomicrobia bacterium]|nr:MAG: hypothetical protein DME45_04300 [Verrucomicrobiota bacterium]